MWPGCWQRWQRRFPLLRRLLGHLLSLCRLSPRRSIRSDNLFSSRMNFVKKADESRLLGVRRASTSRTGSASKTEPCNPRIPAPVFLMQIHAVPAPQAKERSRYITWAKASESPYTPLIYSVTGTVSLGVRYVQAW